MSHYCKIILDSLAFIRSAEAFAFMARRNRM